jgi:hypothetical protein
MRSASRTWTAFRGQKKAQGLGATSINKLLACVAAILELAVEYG